jgi:hypothetical protein
MFPNDRMLCTAEAQYKKICEQKHKLNLINNKINNLKKRKKKKREAGGDPTNLISEPA